MNRRIYEVVDNICTVLLGVLAIHFVTKTIYNRGFKDGCDATLTANQII